jgi:putative molybdopterin biosynthesis protein
MTIITQRERAMEERLYTPQEAADILKVKKNTIYDMIKKGSLSATKMGKQFRITESDLSHLIKPSTTVPLMPVTTLPSDQNNIILCGQDIVLDMMCTLANAKLGSTRFVRSYEGSYNGLYAMYKDEVTVASVHIWDRISNTYNIPYVHALIPGEKVQLFHILNRPVGFYVAKGNPKNITSIMDFARNDVSIVNRERGSGVRILTDSLLNNNEIDSTQIHGYGRIVNSHLAAAAVVSKGGADCAIGNKNVALQFGTIDFIFLQNEQYDIAIKESSMNRPEIQAILDVLQSDAFHEEVNAMGLYDTSNMGKRLI